MARDRKFPWFRVYSELANERKIIMISRLIGWSKSQTIGAWIIMLCMANDSPERGKLLIAPGVPCTKADIASEIEITPDIQPQRSIIPQHSPAFPEHGDHVRDIFFGSTLKTELAGYAIITKSPVRRACHDAMDRLIGKRNMERVSIDNHFRLVIWY